jgi:hypothetical protein
LNYSAATELALSLAIEIAAARAFATHKDFLALWKDSDSDSDSDIPIYKQAKAEYEKLR